MLRELIDWQYEKSMADSDYPEVNDARPRAIGGFNNQVGRAYSNRFLTAEDYEIIVDEIIAGEQRRARQYDALERAAVSIQDEADPALVSEQLKKTRRAVAENRRKRSESG